MICKIVAGSSRGDVVDIGIKLSFWSIGLWWLDFLGGKQLDFCLHDFMIDGVAVFVNWCLSLPKEGLWLPWCETSCFEF